MPEYTRATFQADLSAMTAEQLAELASVVDAMPRDSVADLEAIIAEVRRPRSTPYRPPQQRREGNPARYAALLGEEWPRPPLAIGGEPPRRRRRRRVHLDVDDIPVLPASVEADVRPRHRRSDIADQEQASSTAGGTRRVVFAPRVLSARAEPINLAVELGSGRRFSR